MISGELVDRPRLLDRLDGFADRRLTLLIGPAGAGKSTLLHQWASRRSDLRLVQVGLDSELVEPLAIDLTRRIGGPGDLDRVLSASSLDEALIDLCRRQAETGVIDLLVDCGPAGVSAAQSAFLDRLLNARSSGLRLVLAARSMPPLSLGHLLTSGELGMVGHDELAFTVDEVRAAARARLDRPLDQAEEDELQTRTGGWVAGVLCTLAAAAASGDATRAVSVDAALGRIDAFIGTEVLDRLDDRRRSFLHEIAELEQIQPGVCDAVLGRDDSTALLEELAHSLGFLVLDDPGQGIYRLDPLFRTTLRRTTRHERPERSRRIAESAAAYYARRGDRLETAANLIALERHHEAIDQLGVFAQTSVNAHELHRARVLCDRVPAEAYRSHPEGLQILASILLILRDGAAVEAILDELEDAADESSPKWWANRTFVLGARVTRGQWNTDPSETLREVETVLGMLDDVPPGVPTGLDSPPFDWTRGLMWMHGAIALFRMDRFEEAGRWAGTARVLGRRQPTAAVRLWSLDALIAATVGELDAVEHHAARAENLAEAERPDRRSITVDAEMARVIVALERDRVDVAEATLERLADMEEFPFPPDTAARLGILQARVCLARGALRAGLVVCDELRRSLPGGLPLDSRAALGAVEARLAIRYGQPGHARRLVQTDPLGRESYAAVALVHWLERDHGALATVLGRWRASPCVVNRIEYLIFRALQADHANRPDKRYRHLVEATRAARPGGFTRVFLDTAPGVVDLLATEVRRNQRPDPSLIATLKRLGVDDATPHADLGPAFSPREASIVALLPTHLTGVEIAGKLGISPSTLKSHQQRIYRKLGVRRRSDAVARVREIGLIDP